MGFLKKLGRGLGFGADRHAANQRYRGIRKYVHEQEGRDEAYLSDLRHLSEGMFKNSALLDLLGPSFASRAAGSQMQAVDQGTGALKSAMGAQAARNRIGKSQMHRQAYQADLAGAGQKAAIRGQHEMNRTNLANQVAQQQAQQRTDIRSIDKNLEDSREALLSKEKVKRDVDVDRAKAADMGRGIQMAAMAAGGAMGGMGMMGGMGGMQGMMGGMQSMGGMMGQMGGMNPAALFQGLSGGILPQGNYGSNPLLTYMLSGMMSGPYAQPQGAARQHNRGVEF